MNWIIYLRLALAIIKIIQELDKGDKADKNKIIAVAETVIPERYKQGLSQLTKEDIEGVKEAFLVAGTMFEVKE